MYSSQMPQQVIATVTARGDFGFKLCIRGGFKNGGNTANLFEPKVGGDGRSSRLEGGRRGRR